MTWPAQPGTAPIGVAAAYAGTPTASERMLLLSPRDSDAAKLTASVEIAGETVRIGFGTLRVSPLK